MVVCFKDCGFVFGWCCFGCLVFGGVVFVLFVKS